MSRVRRRLPRSLVLGALLGPALALAEEPPRLPDPRGLALLEALPAAADLAVHTPDLPRLLASAEEAGLGTAAAWRTAFEAQLRRFGEPSGEPDRLARAGLALLRAADGEAVVAGLGLPDYGAGEETRATLLAFRSRQPAERLRAALADAVAAGLGVAYPGQPSEQQVAGRGVLALTAPGRGLWIHVSDGFVAAADHPLALGLLFRGLEPQAERPAPDPATFAAQRLEVRHGRGADRFTGWTVFEKESVSWPATEALPQGTPLGPEDAPVLAISLHAPRDLPLFPLPVPASAQAAAGPGRLVLRRDGSFSFHVGGESPSRPPAASWRLGWLTGLAEGGLPLPVPGLERALLAGPLAAARARGGEGELVPWEAGDTPGELRGPRWSGPATFLALRTLHDIATRTAPGAPAAAAEAAKPAGAPLPPPAPDRGR